MVLPGFESLGFLKKRPNYAENGVLTASPLFKFNAMKIPIKLLEQKHKIKIHSIEQAIKAYDENYLILGFEFSSLDLNIDRLLFARFILHKEITTDLKAVLFLIDSQIKRSIRNAQETL